jgi:uncharacterized protein YndB with AHSA1/START domain
METAFEVPGPPEQVWAAIATGGGLSSWFMRADVEERVGGSIVFHLGEDTSAAAEITGYDAPHRLAYVEPNWAEVMGHPEAVVSPMATEFLIEAQSGGTCVVRVVSSAFGTGGDWEREFFADMEKGWGPMLDNLRLYLTHFPGQQATVLATDATLAGSAADVCSAICRTLGAESVGQTVTTRGLDARLERVSDFEVLLRLADPPGFLMFGAADLKNGSTWTQVQGYLFSDDAAAYVEREQPEWKAWLEALEIEDASSVNV